jgi:hypothetical protein
MRSNSRFKTHDLALEFCAFWFIDGDTFVALNA